MQLFLVAIPVGLLCGLAFGTPSKNEVSWRATWLLLVGIGMMLLSRISEFLGTDGGAVAGWLITNFVLLLWTALNLRKPGFWLLFAGLALNIAVVAANWGMPVRSELPMAGIYMPMDSGTRLQLLADWLPIVSPRGATAGLASPGDLLLAAGAAAAAFALGPRLRSRVRGRRR